MRTIGRIERGEDPMGGERHIACTDCEDCGGGSPSGVRPGGFPGRAPGRLHRRTRARRCDVCGHLVRLHALEVAPSADAIAVAPLPPDPADAPVSLWSTAPAAPVEPVDPTEALAPRRHHHGDIEATG